MRTVPGFTGGSRSSPSGESSRKSIVGSLTWPTLEITAPRIDTHRSWPQLDIEFGSLSSVPHARDNELAHPGECLTPFRAYAGKTRCRGRPAGAGRARTKPRWRIRFA